MKRIDLTRMMICDCYNIFCNILLTAISRRQLRLFNIDVDSNVGTHK